MKKPIAGWLKNIFIKLFSLSTESCLIHSWTKWVPAKPESTSSTMYKFGLVATHERECRQCKTIQLRVMKEDI